MSKFGLLCLSLLLLSACTANNSTTPASPTGIPTATLPVSAWGAVQLIAQAEDLDAPALLPLSQGNFFAWTGSAEGEARLFSRGITGNSQIMALKAFHPMEQRLFLGGERVLLLWLDREDATQDMRLQAALLNQNGIAERGIISLSDIPTRRYDAIQATDQTLTIVYSGGLGAVNNLYLSRADNAALSYIQADLRNDADYPALIADASGTILFWLESNGEAAYIGRLGERELSAVRRIARINLPANASVEDFRAAYDGEYAYLFWQIRRWDGSRYTLMSVGTLDGEFSPVTELDASWVVPAGNSTSAGLPIALNIGNQLGIAYLNGGTIGEFQPIVDSDILVGEPHLSILPDGRMVLSWSSPTNQGYANLMYTEEN